MTPLLVVGFVLELFVMFCEFGAVCGVCLWCFSVRLCPGSKGWKPFLGDGLNKEKDEPHKISSNKLKLSGKSLVCTESDEVMLNVDVNALPLWRGILRLQPLTGKCKAPDVWPAHDFGAVDTGARVGPRSARDGSRAQLARRAE